MHVVYVERTTHRERGGSVCEDAGLGARLMMMIVC